MAGYIGKSQGVTQVDGYNRTEADDRYVNASGDTMTGTLSVISNIGIGEPSPSWPLHITNATAPVIQLEETSIGNTFIGQDSDTFFIRRGSVGNVSALAVDTAGRVTMPYQPSFCASRLVDQARTENDVVADLVYDQVIHNTGGHYNSSNGRFTAPVSGAYMFSFGARFDFISATYTWIRLNKNSTTQADNGFPNCITQQTGTYFTIGASGCVYLNQGDYVSVSVYVSGDASWDFENASYFSGFLIG